MQVPADKSLYLAYFRGLAYLAAYQGGDAAD